ncbi:CHY zinc finger protein, partial [Cardiosporidium cionae]
CGKSCDRCHTEVFVNYHPQFSFQNDSRIGSLDLFECALWDVQSGDCKVLCEQCNSETLFRAVKNGTVRDVTCRSCYAKLNFRFDKFATVETRRLQYSDESNTDGNRIENQLQRLNLEKQNTDRRKEKPKSIGVSIKIGTSLPGLGTCKHYKKSHRWLRFPCCLKVFPCDICHDAASDHPHEWARRMICGFCSKEQCYSSKQCSCGHAVTAKRSAFWEGGHGCRNTTFMNKKDNRKYKRPSSKAKVTPQKKKS